MNTVALLGNPLTSMFLASIYVKLDIVAVTSTGSNDETAPKAEAVLMLLLYLLSQDSVVHFVPEIVALVRRVLCFFFFFFFPYPLSSAKVSPIFAHHCYIPMLHSVDPHRHCWQNSHPS
jgi:hypothetical protein